MSSRDGDIFRSIEVRLVVVVALGSLALLLAIFESCPRAARWRMVDLAGWSFSSRPPAEPGFFAELQPRHAAQRSFELTLQLVRPPRAGDFAAAEGRIEVGDQPGPFCFRAFVNRPQQLPDASSAAGIEARLSLGGRPAVSIPVTDLDEPVDVRIRDVAPVDGAISVRFEVRAVTDGGGLWQRASHVRIEFADLWTCDGD
jgi:hypothetical protein